MTDTTSLSCQTRPQAQAGVRLRVKILGGDLSAKQWRMLAHIGRQFTPAAPLHLTTRQDVEYHALPAEQVPIVQQLLSQVGLTGKQACGNTVRNVTVCPCSGVRTGLPDLGPLAWQIRRTLEAIEGDLALPRKFKISLSACPEACGQPFINDLGLVAVRAGAGWVFRVIVAGSLGARPALGVLFQEGLPPEDVLPLAVAALRVFAAHADRKNRTTARLRHVRQRLGEEAFAATLRQAFRDAQAERDWPRVELATVEHGFDARLPLTFPDGNLSPQEAEALAGLADNPLLRLRIDNHHRVIVAAKDEGSLRQALAGAAPLEPHARPQPAIVACPGRRWCKHGLIDPAALAARLRAELAGRLPGGLPGEILIGISGCPNNCGHSAVADIGITGGRSGAGDQAAEKCTVVSGGGKARTNILAQTAAAGLSGDQTVLEVARLAKSLAGTAVPSTSSL